MTAALAVVTNPATEHMPQWLVGHPMLLWLLVAALAVLSAVIAVLQVRAEDPDIPGRDLEGAVAQLREKALGVWRREAVVRGILDPLPLRLRWSSTGRPVAASRTLILQLKRPGADFSRKPLIGDLDTIVEKYRTLPRGQLVVLGQPGAGKSILAMLFTLRVLEEQALYLAEDPEHPPVEPVPVLLPIADWNPTELLDDWLARRLAEEYPFLSAAAQEPRQTLAQALIAAQPPRLLPVLDGLDEIPTIRHEAAITGLRALADRPLVLTCRSIEYENAIASIEEPLTAAAVIELQPVGPREARDYLAEPDLEPRRRRWQTLLDHLSDLAKSPAGSRSDPVGQALTTPLMVSLTRAAYRRPNTRPAELLDLPTRGAVQTTLIGGYLSSIYPERSDDTPPVPEGARKLRRYDAGAANRWLTTIAYQAYQAGTGEFWWWQLDPGLLATRPARARTVPPVAATLIAAGQAGLVGGLLGGPGIALRSAVVAAIILGVNIARVFAPLWPRVYAPHVHRTYRPARVRLAQRWALRTGMGLLCGTATGVLTGHLLLCAVAGLCGVLATATLLSWRSLPCRAPRDAASDTTVSAALRFSVLSGTTYGLTSALFTALVLFLHFGRIATVVLTGMSVAGVTTAVTVTLAVGGWAWLRYRLTHLQLATMGRLPPRLNVFLHDAHHRGALRRAGTAWQLRHALVQDHLVYAYRPLLLAARADAGDRDASDQLAGLLAEQGGVDEALAILRSRADGYAARRLVDLLAEQGRVDELRSRVDAGDEYAADRFASVLAEQGSVDELRSRVDAGDRIAAWWLADLLAEQGRVDESLAILRSRADAGDRDADGWLVDLLAEQGRVDELRSRVDAGDGYAARRLADLLAEQGRVDEALTLLRSDADAGDEYAARRLADLLAEQGRLDEALTLLRSHADAGDKDAADWLASVLAKQGRVDELRSRVDAGDEYAARRLADLLAEQGHMDEALAVLRSRADAGDGYAARRLADLLAEQGHMDEALAVLRSRADAGDVFAADRLADLLAGQSQGSAERG